MEGLDADQSVNVGQAELGTSANLRTLVTMGISLRRLHLSHHPDEEAQANRNLLGVVEFVPVVEESPKIEPNILDF